MRRYVRSSEDLAVYLRDFRWQQELSQTELAKRFGLKQKTISKFENSPGSSEVETLFKILAGLGLELILTPRDERAEEIENLEW